MKLFSQHLAGAAAILLIAALLSPALAPLLTRCGSAPGGACENGTPQRCAGLWSAACCNFVSPPSRTTAAELANAARNGLFTPTYALVAERAELTFPWSIDSMWNGTDAAAPPGGSAARTSVLLL